MFKDSRDAAQIFAEYAADLKYEDIPEEAREASRRSILDTIGAILAGTSHDEGFRALVDLVREGGGKPESTILGYGDRVPVWMAALANNALCGVLHLDDTYDEAVTHPSSTSVPAALAVAERTGNISGRQLITAVTIGNDITCRLGLAICQRERGWLPDWYQTSVHGVFGAAAAAGKILGLDAARISAALGIALYQSAGTLEGPGVPSNFTAMGAVLAVLMAERGIKGTPTSLEGKAGLFNVYYGGDYNRKILIGELGKRFRGTGISFKPWPGLRYFHPYIDASIQLVTEYDIKVPEIKQIVLHVAGYVSGNCTPIEKRRYPQTLLEAITSLPYLVAVAVAHRNVRIKDLSEGQRDPLIRKASAKVVTSYDERFSITNEIGPAMVTIELNNGQQHTKQVFVAYGHPRNPLTETGIKEKFRDCVSQSLKPLSADKVDKVITMVDRLDDLDDVSRLIRLLS